MFAPNSFLVVEETREYRNRLLSEADQFKLARLQRGSATPRFLRPRRRIGGWLIALGHHLLEGRGGQPLPTA